MPRPRLVEREPVAPREAHLGDGVAVLPARSVRVDGERRRARGVEAPPLPLAVELGRRRRVPAAAPRRRVGALVERVERRLAVLAVDASGDAVEPRAHRERDVEREAPGRRVAPVLPGREGDARRRQAAARDARELVGERRRRAPRARGGPLGLGPQRRAVPAPREELGGLGPFEVGQRRAAALAVDGDDADDGRRVLRQRQRRAHEGQRHRRVVRVENRELDDGDLALGVGEGHGAIYSGKESCPITSCLAILHSRPWES